MEVPRSTCHPDAEALRFAYASVAQVRIARPTDQLDAVTTFYRDGLGLEQVDEFRDHGGYDGVMFGLPGRQYHLEFTRHVSGSRCPAPSTDNLLVLYIPDPGELKGMRERLEALGHRAVEPGNPYWRGQSVTYEDPDGWRVVLCNSAGI